MEERFESGHEDTGECPGFGSDGPCKGPGNVGNERPAAGERSAQLPFDDKMYMQIDRLFWWVFQGKNDKEATNNG